MILNNVGLIRPTMLLALCRPDKRERHAAGGYSFGLKRSSRLALLTTVMEESAIAAPATTGFSSVPVNGHRIPAATGIPMLL